MSLLKGFPFPPHSSGASTSQKERRQQPSHTGKIAGEQLRHKKASWVLSAAPHHEDSIHLHTMYAAKGRRIRKLHILLLVWVKIAILACRVTVTDIF